MPGDGPESPPRRLRARGGAALPAKARRALGGPPASSEGGAPEGGAGGSGACDAEGGPERLRNAGVAKIPELKM